MSNIVSYHVWFMLSSQQSHAYQISNSSERWDLSYMTVPLSSHVLHMESMLPPHVGADSEVDHS